MQPQNTITVIIEHMEEYLYEWCYYQYENMKAYLADYNCNLWITNSQAFFNYEGQYKQDNEKYLQKLKELFSESWTKLIPEKFKQLLENQKAIKNEGLCLLDMRAKQQLKPNEKWNTIVFGGILGDHPPRDRSKPLRDVIPQMRHLGSLQLATDTAVLVSRLILRNQLKLQEIPMIKQPTIKGNNEHGEKTVVQMDGFSYISKQLDIKIGKLNEGITKKEKKEVYMHQGIRKLLLNEDLDSAKLM